MRIVLKTEVDKLGKTGDIVTVKDGYARNYLIPAGLALLADERNLKALEAQRRQAETRALREMKTHQAVAQRMAKIELTATVQVGEEDRMFGAVTATDIAELLAAQGIEIDRRIIALEEPIKALGVYTVPIKLHAGVEAHIKIRVEKAEAV
ncbi:MAG: 50S ribosomal protein L9 [Calditrichaeota bacterium]|nr:50S ribosomal protein L9 [Calditrichota bacterium]